jgi:soluble lytic murein transglycosylase-like protein
MGRLMPVLCGLALFAATPAAADPVARWQALIDEASARCGIPAAWIVDVMRAESGGRTALNGRAIVSRAGAMGLMQLMPGTWADMRGALGLGPDPHAPRDNILAGACYLRRLYDRFGHPGLFAAYNAGPVRYARHLRTGYPLPAETRAYLAGLAGSVAGHAAGGLGPVAVADERPGLFFPLRRDAGMSRPQPRPGPLFVLLRGGAVAARQEH